MTEPPFNPYQPPATNFENNPGSDYPGDSPSKMPKRVLVIGLLFCLGGVCAIWDVLSALFRSCLNLNFAVLLLPVGIGLLRGKPSSQWWARFWIILGYVLCGLLVVFVPLLPGSAHATWFGTDLHGPEAVPYVIGMALFFAVLLFVLHKLLYSEKANRFFRRDRPLTRWRLP
jgi:uncharacterized membrane protein (DUF485 family)